MIDISKLLRRCSDITGLVAFIIIGLIICNEAFAQGLFDHGAPRIYKNDSLSAIQIPVGGIGAGTIRMNGSATRDNGWWIWGEWGIYPMKTVTNSFFGMRAQAGSSAAVVRALQTANQGNWQKMTSLTFRAEYPFGWYDFLDAAMPVKVSLEVFNPFIPLDSKNSAIPCAIYNFTVENTSAQNVTVNLLGAQLNCIGTGVLTGYGSNINSIIKESGSTILSMRSQIASSQRYFGSLALMAFQQIDQVTATASWSTLDELLNDFSADGALTGADSAGPTASGQTVQGALSVASTLAPGEKKTIRFMLTWYFPNRVTLWGPNTTGPKYATWWTSALDVARYLNQNLADLTAKTRLYNATFYTSNLPHWMLDGAANNTAILRSPTVFWNKDGYLGINEGWRNDTHQDGNCAHVIQYAQGLAYLFPDLARTNREGVFNYQYKTTGAINFRGFNPGAGNYAALDGQCGEILSVYREYLHSADGSAWMTQMWSKTKSAMTYAITTWDSNEDGVLSGAQWNTLDNYMNGSCTWHGSLYLAALAASERMATIVGDADFASRCQKIRSAGSTSQDNALFNNSLGYYIHIPSSATSNVQYGNGCEIDQLLGQYWSNLLGLGWFYPKNHIKTALQSLYKNNFHTNFIGYNFQGQRHYVSANDAGLIMCSWPSGATKPSNPIGYYAECMTGFEYAAGCAMIQAGLLTEGFTVFKACRDRYNGKARTDWWMNPGGDPFMEIEWGYYYFRALASWSAIPACQGYVFDGPGKAIGFHPVFKPAGHISFFIGSEGYGVFSQARGAACQMDTITLKSGKLTLMQLDLYTDSLGVEKVAEVKLNGAVQGATATFGSTDGNVHIVFASDVNVNTGDVLTVTIGKAVTGIMYNAAINTIRDVQIRTIGENIHLIVPGRDIEPPAVTIYELSGKAIPLRCISGADPCHGDAYRSWIFAFDRKNMRLAKGIYVIAIKTRTSHWTGKITVHS